MLNTKFFDAISSAVDLDEPVEQFFVQRFMIEALGGVTQHLPAVARFAAANTVQLSPLENYLDGVRFPFKCENHVS